MDRRQNENFFNRHPSSPTPQKQARGKSLKNNLKLANIACQLYCNLNVVKMSPMDGHSINNIGVALFTS